MTTERNSLPGCPSNRLIKDVRKVLWTYLRSRPESQSNAWQLAWEWANNIRHRNGRYLTGKARGRWPLPNEIASQYLFLVLAEMKDFRALRLPFHAAECVPENLSQRLGLLSDINQGPLLLTDETA